MIISVLIYALSGFVIVFFISFLIGFIKNWRSSNMLAKVLFWLTEEIKPKAADKGITSRPCYVSYSVEPVGDSVHISLIEKNRGGLIVVLDPDGADELADLIQEVAKEARNL